MFETRSGKPWQSLEQREYFEEKKKEAFLGLEDFFSDPEFKKMPFFNMYSKGFKTWQKWDFKIMPNIHPFQLFLNEYNNFNLYIENLDYILRCQLAQGDIEKELFDICMNEIKLRKLKMDSELDMKLKSNFNYIFKDEKSKKDFHTGLQQSILQRSKDLYLSSKETLSNNDSTDSTE